jgi:hypothetical protein
MTKYIKIDTIGTDDTNALFEEICKNIIQAKPLKAKRDVLGMTGKDKHLEEHKVTINQLMAVISRYEIACEIKISYPDKSDAKEDILVPKYDKDGLKKDVIINDMSRQVDEITNPELKDLTTANVVEKKNESVASDLPKIPDFLDF